MKHLKDNNSEKGTTGKDNSEHEQSGQIRKGKIRKRILPKRNNSKGGKF